MTAICYTPIIADIVIYEKINTSYYKNRPVKLDSLPVRAVYIAHPGWVTTVGKVGSDTQFNFSKNSPIAPLQTHDIYAMRDSFLSFRTPEQAKELFDKYGAFTETPVGQLEGAATPVAPPVMFSELVGLQEMIRIMSKAIDRNVDAASFRRQYAVTEGDLAGDAPNLSAVRLGIWARQLLYALPINVIEQDGMPVASVERYDFFGALQSAVHLDFLRRAENAICARRDCGQVFERTDPRKRYCGKPCARLEAVRAFRERKRDLGKQSLTPKVKGKGQ